MNRTPPHESISLPAALCPAGSAGKGIPWRAAEPRGVTVEVKRSSMQGVLRRPWLTLGLLLAAVMLLVAVLAPVIAPHDPLRYDPRYARPVGPSPDHLLGTDSIGRDVLSRLVYGARISLTLGIGAMALAVVLG